jgi:uroporphyrinogen decarboxylase
MPSPLLDALQGRTPERLPVWLMRQAGRYLPEYRALRDEAGGFWHMATTPDIATEITLQPIERFDFDAAVIFSDILVVPYALGQEVRFLDTIGPVLGPLPPVLRYDSSRISCVYTSIKQVRGALSQDKAVIGFAGAPWTLACYMLGGRGGKDFMEARAGAWRDTPEFQALMDTLTQAVATHLVAQAHAGADVLQLFDSWAFLAPNLARWVTAPARAIVQRVRAQAPGVPIIGFPRGLSPAGYADYVQAVQPDGISLDERTSSVWAAEHIQPHCAVQGNLDPACLLAGGPALRAEVQRIVHDLSRGPHIMNLGHGVHKDTPPDHVHALIRAAREF